ncbi:LysR family transcriptional regulator ArgP [Shimia aestuarii]|uniref:LysR family transcriptional regulator, chromosome initiation inhibitor n=1 Tax=Shimia aestuarii TaxID=254406 RepID=A0A1I4RGH8_9RHOB|nr:LysR family transcriptional regulator ArgP [Shimia aestuarii]SFM51388.1 LysR family transcriptional regulator, chromosome initiation inhibitor [Shimia aestuarii]
MQIDYAQLSALAAILRTGSFDGAAAALGITQSAVSQRLKALEERVGTPLVLRGQPCSGTETGRRLAAHLDQVGLLEQDLARDLAGLTPRTARLRVAVNADSLATWFLHAAARVPDILFDLVVDDQDFSADWLRRGEVVAAVTAHETPIAGCDSHPLGAIRYLATASPNYMQRWFPEAVTAENIARAPMLRFDAKDRLQQIWMTRHLGRAPTPPSHRLPSSQGFVEACLLGLGWGMNPEALVADHIASGRLVPLLPDAPHDVPLHWQASRLVAPALAPLTREVRRAARSTLI